METDWIGERIGSAPRRAVAGILIESEWKTRLRERGGGGGGGGGGGRYRGDDKVIVQFRKLREKKGGRERGEGGKGNLLFESSPSSKRLVNLCKVSGAG